MSNEFIPLAIPNIGALEVAAVTDAVHSGFVSSVGPEVQAFETAFADLVGSEFAVACVSGTAALHVALQIVGVGPGDEVMCSDFSFAGSGNPIAYLGANPLFVDSEDRTWNADQRLIMDELKRRLSTGEKLPAAIEIVHILGQPAAVDELIPFAEKLGIPVVEDAAESLGAGWTLGKFKDKATGSVGTVGCFSFNGNKITTAGGGGMIVTNDKDLAEHARHLTTQAKVPNVGYLHDEIGYNYRLTNLAAALGLAQLKRLPEFLEKKRQIAAAYDEAFADLDLVKPPREDGFDSSYWLYSVLVKDMGERDALLEMLSTNHIGARALWRPLSQQPSFADTRTLGQGHVAQSFFDRGVSLPSSTTLTNEEQKRVIQTVREFYG